MKNAIFSVAKPVAIARTDVSKENIASIIRVTRVTWRNIPENGILQSHLRVNLKYYMKNAQGYETPARTSKENILRLRYKA
jgi:hypothetical protein